MVNDQLNHGIEYRIDEILEFAIQFFTVGALKAVKVSIE
jgi:hypothetical protein